MKNILLALIRNDFRLFLSDRRAFIIAVIVPVTIASFFGMILGGGGGSGKSGAISVLVADGDNSALTKEIIKNFDKGGSLKVTTVTEVEAREKVKAGKVGVALILPKGLEEDSSRAFFSGPDAERPKVQILYDPSHSAEYQMVRGLVMQEVMQTVSAKAFSSQGAASSVDEQLKSLQGNTDMDKGEKDSLTDLLTSVKKYYGRPASSSDSTTETSRPGGLQMPVTITDEAIAAKDVVKVSTVTHSFAGMAVQGVLFFAIDCAMAIMRDRRNGLWKRLRAAPLSRGLLLGSKVAGTSLIALFIILLIFGAGRILFGVKVTGSLPGFLMICTATSIFVATFGLLVAALGKTEQQSRGFAVPAVLAMTLLGGAWFPSFLMPAWVQKVTLIMPSRWAVDGFDAMTWRGFGISSALLPTAILLGFSIAFGAFAFVRFRWDAE